MFVLETFCVRHLITSKFWFFSATVAIKKMHRVYILRYVYLELLFFIACVINSHLSAVGGLQHCKNLNGEDNHCDWRVFLGKVLLAFPPLAVFTELWLPGFYSSHYTFTAYTLNLYGLTFRLEGEEGWPSPGLKQPTSARRTSTFWFTPDSNRTPFRQIDYNLTSPKSQFIVFSRLPLDLYWFCVLS